jgi:hypothetical protein
LCVASSRKNLSQGQSFGGCGFIYAFFKVKIMLGEQGKFLIEFLREQTTRTKTPVLDIILEYQ